MKKLFILIILWFLSFQLVSKPLIIFDTDFGGDADDLGALVMLHNFINRGECEVLAIMSWSLEENTVSAIDAVNRFYKHEYIPIGTRKGSTYFEPWNYNQAIIKKLPYKITYNEAPDAVYLYRKILSNSPDTSITIVTVGPLANLKSLIESPSDSISNMTGLELIKSKVKEFVIMGGQFPEGKNEWNFNGNMPGITKFVLENIEVPVTFSGYEIGVDIKTGAKFNEIDPEHPLYIGFMHFSQNAPWMKEYFQGKILNNSSYDQTAVLYAVSGGIGKYWIKITDGFCIADEDGGNKWVKLKSKNHAYLKLIIEKDEMANIIESLMLGNY